MQCRNAGLCLKVWADSFVDVTISPISDPAFVNTVCNLDATPETNLMRKCNSQSSFSLTCQTLIGDGKKLEPITGSDPKICGSTSQRLHIKSKSEYCTTDFLPRRDCHISFTNLSNKSFLFPLVDSFQSGICCVVLSKHGEWGWGKWTKNTI